jgi:hypothetical protein
VTIQSAFISVGGIPPPSARGRWGKTPQTPPGRNSIPRLNEPSRTDWGVLRPSNTARNRAGSTTMHGPRNEQPTVREATKYHVPKLLAVRATRGSKRRPGIGGWETRTMRYALFVYRELSHLSGGSKGVSRGQTYTAHVGSGTAVHDTAAAPEGLKGFRGATNLVRPTACLCGFPTRSMMYASFV